MNDYKTYYMVLSYSQIILWNTYHHLMDYVTNILISGFYIFSVHFYIKFIYVFTHISNFLR